MSFADFLDVMHAHSRVEDLPREVVEAFRAADFGGRGAIPARQLRHMLLRWGEKLSTKEGTFLVFDTFGNFCISSLGYIFRFDSLMQMLISKPWRRYGHVC